MNDTIKNHALKITIGTAIVSLIFIIGITWRASAAVASEKIVDEQQEVKISALQLALDNQRLDTLSKLDEMNEKVGEMRDSLIQIKTVLGVSELELPSGKKSSINY